MRYKCHFTKKDLVVASGCCLFLLASLGTIGDGGRRRAKEAVCISNVKRWGVLFRTFAEDNGGYFMDRSVAVWWIDTMPENYGSSLRPKIWLCPEATRPYSEGGVNPRMAWQDHMGGTVHTGSYVLNLWISMDDDPRYWKTPLVANAENAPIFLDGQWKDMEPYPQDDPAPYETSVWTPNAQEMRRACISRHNGAVNAVFLDGSVRKVGLKSLWLLKWYRQWPDMCAEPPGLPIWPQWMQNFKDPCGG